MSTDSFIEMKCVQQPPARLDVAQAHLSFTRKSSDADSSMPSLRKIVLPTDWGSVRDQLVNFGERQSNSPFEEVH